jgi:hypothetical protein
MIPTTFTLLLLTTLGGGMAKGKQSLVAAASEHSKRARKTWFDILCKRKPELAKEVAEVTDQFLRGELLNFPSRHAFVLFLQDFDNNAVGAKESAITDWVEQRAKSH